MTDTEKKKKWLIQTGLPYSYMLECKWIYLGTNVYTLRRRVATRTHAHISRVKVTNRNQRWKWNILTRQGYKSILYLNGFWNRLAHNVLLCKTMCHTQNLGKDHIIRSKVKNENILLCSAAKISSNIYIFFTQAII